MSAQAINDRVASTGKSTSLQRSYQALIEPPTTSSPRLVRQPSTRAYLEELRQAWLRGDRVGRTGRDSGELVELQVIFPGVGETLLTVPDIAGESFEDVFVKRQADSLATEHIRNAEGLLLFTHPDHLRPRIPIAALRQMQALLGDAEMDSVVRDERQFDPRLVPSEVQLVDLLQWALLERDVQSRAKRQRIAVLISAWDKVGQPLDKVGHTPSTWLSVKMPMFQSFVEAHCDLFEVSTYGVCAQGGDYDLEPVADRRPSRTCLCRVP